MSASLLPFGPPMHQAGRGGNPPVAAQNYPQPKALAGLDIFVYVSRQCALPAPKAFAR
jgi:hypothetical protein